MSDAWYLDADDYYVSIDQAVEYPVRQGDLITLPDDEEGWLAAQIVHPTCELAKNAVKEVQGCGSGHSPTRRMTSLAA